MSHTKRLLASIPQRVGTLWWYTLLGFTVHRLGDVVNVFIGLYLVPKLLPGEDLGALLPLMSIGAVFSTPLALLLLPVPKFLNVFAAHDEPHKVRALLEDSVLVSLVFAVLVTLWVWWQRDAILLRLQVSDHRLIWPVAGFAILVCLTPIINEALRSLQYFKFILITGLISPYVRLLGILTMLVPLGALGYLLAQLAANLFAVVFGVVVLWLALRKMGNRGSYRENRGEMLAYALPSVVLSIVARFQMPIETMVIRHRLSAMDSAGYFFAVMLGNIPTYLTGALTPFLWPIISDRFERGQKTSHLLLQSMVFTMAIGFVFVIASALLMPWFFTLPGPWHPYRDYAGFVWQVALIGTLKMTQGVFTTHEKACRRFVYMRYLVPLMAAECAVLYLLPGWSFFEPYLPKNIWENIGGLYRPSLQWFVGIILAANCLFTLAMLLEWFARAGGRRRAGAT